MKNKLLPILLLFITSISLAQNKKYISPVFESVNDADVYLNYEGKKIAYTAIHSSNIEHLFGRPIKKATKKSTEGTRFNSYTYKFGQIIIVDDIVDHFSIDKPGLAYLFKTTKGYSKPILVGSDATYLKELFPNSWKSMNENFVWISLQETEVSVFFKVRNSKITSMGFTTNDTD